MSSQPSVTGGLRGATQPLSPESAPTVDKLFFPSPQCGPTDGMKASPFGTPFSTASTTLPAGTPFSTASTASPTAPATWLLPDSLTFSREISEFSRQMSGMSTAMGEGFFNEPGPFGPHPFISCFAEPEKQDGSMCNRYTREEDGILWEITKGTQESPPVLSTLKAELAEVKALFKQKYGYDVEEDEEEEEECKTYTSEKDGVLWEVTKGTDELPPKLSALDAQLAQVKVLFKQKFGYIVEEDEEECKTYTSEKDGILWEVTKGTDELPPKLSALNAQLAQVKALFKEKHGYDVDEEDDEPSRDERKTYFHEDDGISWEVTRGTMESPPEISALDGRLAEVKALFKQKYGHDVDEEEEDSDEQCGGERKEYTREDDGITWEVTKGTKESPPEIAVLDAKLLEVKAFFKQKFGHDVDDDDEQADVTYRREEDGVLWEITKGTKESPPEISALDAQLAEVKALFKQKHGYDVDEDDEQSRDERKTYFRKDDGISWEVTRGTMESPPDISALDGRLAEVKALFKQKYGHDVGDDDNDQADVEDRTYRREEDGVLWEIVKGTKESPPEISALDAQLAEVKVLFKQKYGHDVDDDDNEQVHSERKTYNYACEKGDVHWEVTKGTWESPLEISALEARLDEVKALYEQRYGSPVDGDDEEGDNRPR